MTKKNYTAGEIETAKTLDPLTNRTFQLRASEIKMLDELAYKTGTSKSILVRQALKDKFGIKAMHEICDVDFKK